MKRVMHGTGVAATNSSLRLLLCVVIIGVLTANLLALGGFAKLNAGEGGCFCLTAGCLRYGQQGSEPNLHVMTTTDTVIQSTTRSTAVRSENVPEDDSADHWIAFVSFSLSNETDPLRDIDLISLAFARYTNPLSPIVVAIKLVSFPNFKSKLVS